MEDDEKPVPTAKKRAALEGMASNYCSECKDWRSPKDGLLTDSFFICAECLERKRPNVAAQCDEPLKIAPGGKCTFLLGHDGPHSWAAQCGEPHIWRSKDQSPIALYCQKPLGHADLHSSEHERVGRVQWIPAVEGPAQSEWGYAFRGPTPGVKHDHGKMDWSLLPWDGLESVVRVLEFGERKYARDGWRKVPDSTTRYRKALLRHVIAWCSGIEVDEETGESHLAHACCCLLFILGKRESP